MTESSFKYRAFISYSHADRRWGDWLHAALETYRVPKKLVGTERREGVVPARVFPIFRDREELPTSSDLGANIREALKQSRFLVVICSPRAAQSHWVNEEILSFKRLGREDRILPLIVDGEPNASDGKPGRALEEECFPLALRFMLGPDGALSTRRSEPIAADARPGCDGRNNARLKLLAGLLGVEYDALRQREHERQRRRLVTWLAASAAVSLAMLALAAFALWQRQQADVQRTLAVENAGRAEVQQKKAEDNARETRRQLAAFYEERGREELLAGAPDKAAPFLLEAWDGDPGRAKARLLLGMAMRPLLGQRFTLDGHLESLRLVAWSPDGRRIATADNSGQVMLSNAETGERTASFRPGISMTGLRFSPDGKRLVATTHQAFVYDCAAAKQLVVLEHGYGAIDDFAWSEDGNLLATVSDGSSQPGKPDGIRVWQLPEGKLLTSLAAGDHVYSVRFSKDHQRLLTSADKGSVQVWDWAASKSVAAFHSDLHVRLAIYGPEEKLIFAGGGRALLCGWSAETGKELFALPEKTIPADNEHPFLQLDRSTGRLFAGFYTEFLIQPTNQPEAKAVAIRHTTGEFINLSRVSPDGSMVFTAYGKIGEIWSSIDGKLQATLAGHDARIADAAFSPDGRQLVTVSDDRRAIVWNWPALASMPDLEGFKFFVNHLCLGAEGDDWLGASTPYESWLWRPSTGAVIARLDHPDEDSAPDSSGDALSTAWSQSRRLVATFGRGRLVRLWDARTGEQKFQFAHPARPVSGCFTPDGSLLATSSQNEVRLWDTASGELRKALPSASGWRKLTFDRTGAKLLAIDAQGRGHVWSRATGERIYSLSEEFGPLRDGEFTPDGASLVTFGVTDPFARLWDASDARLRASFGPHAAKLSRAICSPDGRLLATEGGSGVTFFWDLQTGKAISQWENRRRRTPRVLAFFPKGDFAAAAVGDDLFVIDVPTGSELATVHIVGDIDALEFSPNGRSLLLGAGPPHRVIFKTLAAAVETKENVAGQLRQIGHWQLRDGRLVPRTKADAER